jgi:hypothetical protein
MKWHMVKTKKTLLSGEKLSLKLKIPSSLGEKKKVKETRYREDKLLYHQPSQTYPRLFKQ